MTLRERQRRYEREQIIEALAQHQGHMARTAAALGLGERDLYRRVAAHGIVAATYREPDINVAKTRP